MSDPSPQRDGASTLAYATASTDLKRIERRAARYANASITLALLGFPTGAAASIFMEMRKDLFARAVAERGGFMIFAIMEGLAAACGLLGILSTRGRQSRSRSTAILGTVLGALGSGVVLFMIFYGVIR
jgi:uncharacterized membrane protein YkvI